MNKLTCPDCGCPESDHLLGIGCTTITGWERNSDEARSEVHPCTGQSFFDFDAPVVSGSRAGVCPILCPCERGQISQNERTENKRGHPKYVLDYH